MDESKTQTEKMDKLKLCKLIQKYGLLKGFTIYKTIFSKNQKSKIYLPDIAYPIFIRPKTKDSDVLYHIFIEEELKTNLLDNPVIIDAGAFIGLSTLYFRSRYPHAKIIALEPDINSFKYLKENIKHYNNIHLENKALWHTSGLKLNFIEANSHLGSYISTDKNSHYKAETIAINDLIEKYRLEKIDILKIDIEGAEKEVFSKNTEWLSKVHIILIELHDRKKKGCAKTVMQTLSQYNYNITTQAEYLKIELTH